MATQIFDPDMAYTGLMEYRLTGKPPVYLLKELYSLSEAIIYSMVGNHTDAEDMIQESVLRALKALHKYRIEMGPSKLHTYMSRVIHNRSVSYLKKKTPIPFDPHEIFLMTTDIKEYTESAHDQYERMEMVCRETMQVRFKILNPENVDDAFSLVYEISIPSANPKSVGRFRRVVRMLMLFAGIEDRSVAILLHDVAVFVIRLGMYDLLELGQDEYAKIKSTEEELSLMPEFKLAYMLQDLETAYDLLRGFTMSFGVF
jgi:RNA polymerase sigma factor (sigma-70 family)